MKFLIDMPLSPALVGWLTQHGHDARHAFDLGLGRAADDSIIKHARDEKEIIITADLDYPRILALTRAGDPGLILFRGGDYSEQETIERLARAFESIPDHDFVDSVIVIEKSRIRRRHLPLEPRS